MTSEVAGQCFVYLHLPDQTEAVTAGRHVVEVGRGGAALGRFVYGRRYLARPDCVAIDPVELELGERTYTTPRLGGLFGALRDAAPDHWGRRIIQRHVQKHPLSELDYLLHSPDDRAGALSFGLGPTPPPPLRTFNQTLELENLQELALGLLEDQGDRPTGPAAEQAEELLLLGTSMGGARPKAVVEDGAGLWLAKFQVPGDRWNEPKVEHTMLQLARSCGLRSAISRLEKVGDRDVLLVKRFDRHRLDSGDYLRTRMVSALTLLKADDAAGSREAWSYLLLADELRRVCRDPVRELQELFRRICFNALISNVDDHPRNHAVLATPQGWALSPAYDLTPTPLVSLERRDLAMACGTAGRQASRANLLSSCERFFLGRDQAAQLIDTLADQIRSEWYALARKNGVSVRDCELIRRAFVYEGFSNT